MLLSMWRVPLSIAITPADCFCNVHDWPTSLKNVSQGEGLLDYNHTSLTWHIMTLPATALPLNSAGHRSLSNRAQARRRALTGKAWRKWKIWRTKCVCVCVTQVLLCAKLFLFLSLNLWHMQLPLGILSSFSFPVPSCLPEEPPSQNICNRIKVWCPWVCADRSETGSLC